MRASGKDVCPGLFQLCFMPSHRLCSEHCLAPSLSRSCHASDRRPLLILSPCPCATGPSGPCLPFT